MAGDWRVAVGTILMIVGGFLFVSGLLDVVVVFFAPEAGGDLDSGLLQLVAGTVLVAPPLVYGIRSLREGARARRSQAE